jgi:hypothetical protein
VNGYAERDCHHCTGGHVCIGTSTGAGTEECPTCRGTGTILCFLYPKPKGRRGSWPPEEATKERRAGNAR